MSNYLTGYDNGGATPCAGALYTQYVPSGLGFINMLASVDRYLPYATRLANIVSSVGYGGSSGRIVRTPNVTVARVGRRYGVFSVVGSFTPPPPPVT